MFATIGLVNIQTRHRYNFSYYDKIFKIYSISNFQMYNTALLTIVVMLYVIFPGLIYHITERLYL